jgi:hypothetical protein
MTTKRHLQVVASPPEGSSVLICGILPQWKANDDESLACGKCREVLARNVSTKRMYELHATVGQLMAQCTCGAYNLLPSTRVTGAAEIEQAKRS